MDLDHFLQKQITERKQGGDSLETGASAVPVLASDSFVDSGGADGQGRFAVGRHDAGRAVRSARGTGGAGGSVSRARAINRHELRGNEAGPSRPQCYAHDGHDDYGRADATRSKLGNERCPDRQHAADADAGGSKNDPKPGKNGNRRPLFLKSHLPVFLSVILLLEK
jgi:hypothetical protein